MDGAEFNREIFNPDKFEERFERKKLVGDARMVHPTDQKSKKPAPSTRVVKSKGKALDSAFFEGSASAPRVMGRRAGGGQAFDRVRSFPHQGQVDDQGHIAQDPSFFPGVKGRGSGSRRADPTSSGKKSHKKGKKNVKKRSGAGYEYTF